MVCFFFFQAEDGIRDYKVTGVQTCALPIWGVDAILEFARATETPWRVGLACAAVATAEDEARILPRFLDTSDTSVARLPVGFVWGLFRIGGWAWVSNIPMSTWSETQARQPV